MSRRPCKHPTHMTPGEAQRCVDIGRLPVLDHDSGLCFVCACVCGRSQAKRQDMFDASEVRACACLCVLFVCVSICMCCREQCHGARKASCNSSNCFRHRTCTHTTKTHTHTHMHTCAHTHMHTCAHTHTCTHARTHTHAHMRTHTCPCIHVPIALILPTIQVNAFVVENDCCRAVSAGLVVLPLHDVSKNAASDARQLHTKSASTTAAAATAAAASIPSAHASAQQRSGQAKTKGAAPSSRSSKRSSSGSSTAATMPIAAHAVQFHDAAEQRGFIPRQHPPSCFCLYRLAMPTPYSSKKGWHSVALVPRT